jgi:hypothetical protein
VYRLKRVTLIGAETGIKANAAVHSQCQLGVKTRTTPLHSHVSVRQLRTCLPHRGGPPCATLHSSTVSARSKNESEILRPIAFAVLRLMASSNFVGCSMGISFGCLPCKIRCTNLAP